MVKSTASMMPGTVCERLLGTMRTFPERVGSGENSEAKIETFDGCPRRLGSMVSKWVINPKEYPIEK